MSFARPLPLKKISIGSCFVSVTLDSRNAKREGDVPRQVVVTFHMSGESNTMYYRLPYKMTRSEYAEVQKATGRGRTKNDESSPYDTKKRIEKDFDEIVDRLRKAAQRKAIDKEMLKLFLKSKAAETFTDFWQQFNATKSPGTKASYDGALNSFTKYVGESKRTDIAREDVQKWEAGMAGDGLSRTTIGIYERACKAAWNEAVRQGLAERENYPFGRIPQGAARKKEWLDVDRMTELYSIFVGWRFPDTWTDTQRHNVHQALGLFLFQYLANGINLADVAHLRFDDGYFQESSAMLTFIRQKTAGRSDVEVVIPVIAPLRKVIEALGLDPEVGQRVFPFILGEEQAAVKQRKRVAQVNKEVREGLEILTKSLGWNVKPGGMWARHSFATNLSHAGVPERYISEAMGHTVSTVTSRYIDVFPLPRQKEYNSNLLKLDGPSTAAAESVTIPADEYRRLLKIAESQRETKD